MRPPTKAARSAAEARVRRAYGVAPSDPERAARDEVRAAASWPPIAAALHHKIDLLLDTTLCRSPVLAIELNGPPKPKARARTYVGSDGRPHTRTPAETKAYQEHVRTVARLRVDTHVVWPLGGFPGYRYVVLAHYVLAHDAPDGDNLAKATMDGLNAIVWRDDRDVLLAVPSKRFARPGEKPGASIRVWALATAQKDPTQ